ncbi:LysR family transcriptional regulator [Pelagibacteraceae bacterium]|nr:LysR family transcriptional regulator [Pelagibacteraceae bacterium]
MDWDKLKIFHTVAEAGSFTNASTILNLSQSAISRQIQSLEKDLKINLFERHARGLVLTSNGEYLFKTANDVISKLKEVESNLSEEKNQIKGKLIVTTVVSFGTTWLTPRIKEFMDLHPEIEIELIFNDKELDLATRQADVAIRMRRPKQLNLIQKKFVNFNYHIYGSNEYLQKNGYPKNLKDLDKHKFITYGKGAPSPVYNPDWVLKVGAKDGKKRKSLMKVNSVYGLLLAVQSGVGLAALPDYITYNVNGLTKVLPDEPGKPTETHFVYPASLRDNARLIAFRNFLFSKVNEWKF